MGLDIYDLEGGDLSLRRVWNVVRRCGPDSEIAAERQKYTPEQRAWMAHGPVPWILADLVDVVGAHHFHFLQANSDKGKGPKKPPKPYPRPTSEADKPAKAKGRRSFGSMLPVRRTQ